MSFWVLRLSVLCVAFLGQGGIAQANVAGWCGAAAESVEAPPPIYPQPEATVTPCESPSAERFFTTAHAPENGAQPRGIGAVDHLATLELAPSPWTYRLEIDYPPQDEHSSSRESAPHVPRPPRNHSGSPA